MADGNLRLARYQIIAAEARTKAIGRVATQNFILQPENKHIVHGVVECSKKQPVG